MPNPRFRAYLSKYKEVLSQIWSRGCGGCNPLEDIGCLSHKVLQIPLIQEIIHFSVFIPIHHSFGFPDIFLEGVYPPWIRPCNQTSSILRCSYTCKNQ